ncbi:MAG: hypothetical protein ACDS79_16150, partial [Enterobacteriaceae bacterium]
HCESKKNRRNSNSPGKRLRAYSATEVCMKIFALHQPARRYKVDTVHENETGYSLVLATVTMNEHHSTETGFCAQFCR